MHELQASVHTWKMMLFGSTQWSCKYERHKCRFITSIHEYPPYWKFQLAYFPLRIYTTSNFKWIISFVILLSTGCKQVPLKEHPCNALKKFHKKTENNFGISFMKELWKNDILSYNCAYKRVENRVLFVTRD